MKASETPKLKLRIGDKVRVRGRRGGVAIVQQIYRDIRGGIRLDREVDGFRSWNEDDVKLVERRAGPAARGRSRTTRRRRTTSSRLRPTPRPRRAG